MVVYGHGNRLLCRLLPHHIFIQLCLDLMRCRDALKGRTSSPAPHLQPFFFFYTLLLRDLHMGPKFKKTVCPPKPAAAYPDSLSPSRFYESGGCTFYIAHAHRDPYRTARALLKRIKGLLHTVGADIQTARHGNQLLPPSLSRLTLPLKTLSFLLFFFLILVPASRFPCVSPLFLPSSFSSIHFFFPPGPVASVFIFKTPQFPSFLFLLYLIYFSSKIFLFFCNESSIHSCRKLPAYDGQSMVLMGHALAP